MKKFSIQIVAQQRNDFAGSLFKTGELIGGINYQDANAVMFINLRESLTVSEMTELMNFALNLNSYYEHTKIEVRYDTHREQLRELTAQVEDLSDDREHLLAVNEAVKALQKSFTPSEKDRFYIGGGLAGIVEGSMRANKFFRLQSENVKKGIDFAPGVETAVQVEQALLKYWHENDITEIYKFKGCIKVRTVHMSESLLHILDSKLFKDMVDQAESKNGERTVYNVEELINNREKNKIKSC